MEFEQWEYLRITTDTISGSMLEDRLNDLGQYGWEVCGFASADKTIGLNSLQALVKRRVVPPASPSEATEAGWLEDPTGRWDVRWWDGTFWTHHVGRRGAKNETGRDAPTMLPPYATPKW